MATLDQTAILLIGMQNDHFASDCMLRNSIEQPGRIDEVKERILALVDHLAPTSATLINLPILFKEGHPEITQQVGILAAIKQNSLFVEGNSGGETIPDINGYGDRIPTLHGRTGFNSFFDTDLNSYLTERGIRKLVLVGASTAVCIDSTARSGYELGYDIVVLDDCTISRTIDEQKMYCSTIFPIYSVVTNSAEFVASVKPELATEQG